MTFRARRQGICFSSVRCTKPTQVDIATDTYPYSRSLLSTSLKSPDGNANADTRGPQRCYGRVINTATNYLRICLLESFQRVVIVERQQALTYMLSFTQTSYIPWFTNPICQIYIYTQISYYFKLYVMATPVGMNIIFHSPHPILFHSLI